MRPVIISLLLSITVIIVSSCKKSNPVGSSAEQQFWPLKTGNLWSYHAVGYDSTGAISGSGDQTVSVTFDTVVNGERWYHISVAGAAFYVNRSDGFWEMWNTPSSSTEQLIYKYPASVGDGWSAGVFRISVQSTDTSIIVRSGTHSCYAYRWASDSGLARVDFCSPGVGLVAADYYSRTASGSLYLNMMLSLTSFTLK